VKCVTVSMEQNFFSAKINNILYQIFASEAEKERQPYKVKISYIKFLHRHVREGRTTPQKINYRYSLEQGGHEFTHVCLLTELLKSL